MDLRALDHAILNKLASHINLANTSANLLSGGMNNKVLLLEDGKSGYVLKLYFKDARQRYRREIDFVNLLERHNVTNTPNLISSDSALGFALFEFYPGNPLEHVQEKHIHDAAKFVRSINSSLVKNDAIDLLPAYGSFKSAEDFCCDIDGRLEHLGKVDFHERLTNHLELQVVPLWEAWKSKLSEQSWIGQSGTTILSPSDFGFHNALCGKRGLVFIDFEYAGWDSAEKLVCDFFAQPRYQIDSKHLNMFCQSAFPQVDVPALIEKCSWLLPVAHLKWSLIFLNEFIQFDGQRRAYSTNLRKYDVLEQQEKQLDKSIAKFRLAKMHWDGL